MCYVHVTLEYMRKGKVSRTNKLKIIYMYIFDDNIFIFTQGYNPDKPETVRVSQHFRDWSSG